MTRIVWKYVDKINATINALKDYKNMQRIVEITPARIREAVTKESISLCNDNCAEANSEFDNRWQGVVIMAEPDSLDVMKERYRQAAEFMEWFKPAWDSLSNDEKLLLSEFYCKEQSKTYASMRLAEKMNYEERQIRRLRDKAVKRLSVLLFGG